MGIELVRRKIEQTDRVKEVAMGHAKEAAEEEEASGPKSGASKCAGTTAMKDFRNQEKEGRRDAKSRVVFGTRCKRGISP